MTNGQSDIMKYIELHLPGVTTEMIGESAIRITDGSGRTRDLSINLYGDILEKTPDGKTHVVAVSDLPHNLDDLPLYARPTKWTTQG